MEQLYQFFLSFHSSMTAFSVITLIIFLLLVLVCLKLAYPYQKSIKKARHLPQVTLQEPKLFQSPPEELNSIAGDDVVATQLDLARAYIEMNEKNMAKKILDHVIKEGTPEQKNVAVKLTSSL